jgi:hypothetical protein
VHLKHKLLFLPLLAGDRWFPGRRFALLSFSCLALSAVGMRFGLGVFSLGV